jgi:ABC-type transport system substrate-binding protein
MTFTLPRRGLLGGAIAAAALPWDLALAQAPAGGGTLRVGMTAAAVPLTNGVPDQGAEGHRFMGITLYDHLVTWDLGHADQPARLRPGLATEWHADPANPKRWLFKIREGVTFHDGHKLTAHDIAFSFDRALKSDHPAFDSRASAEAYVNGPIVRGGRL